MKSISIRCPGTIFLIMFLLIGFNLLTTITAAVKDDNEPAYINISRKLLRVPMGNKPPSPFGNPPGIVH
ncbi:hypothetical protein MKX01_040529 [Papaver californicum]|nr:hypothetical protein MKX01_040529 [Papaver californicum]